jgi:hypothetical protein
MFNNPNFFAIIFPPKTFFDPVKPKPVKHNKRPGKEMVSHLLPDLILAIHQRLLVSRVLRKFRSFSYQINLRLWNWS